MAKRPDLRRLAGKRLFGILGPEKKKNSEDEEENLNDFFAFVNTEHLARAMNARLMSDQVDKLQEQGYEIISNARLELPTGYIKTPYQFYTNELQQPTALIKACVAPGVNPPCKLQIFDQDFEEVKRVYEARTKEKKTGKIITPSFYFPEGIVDHYQGTLLNNLWFHWINSLEH